MSFTPFHPGPGVVFKAIGGRHFSFMAFGGAQVLMDIELLVGILAHSTRKARPGPPSGGAQDRTGRERASNGDSAADRTTPAGLSPP